MSTGENILIDKFGRKHDYLRISLLERCNLRCHYCMPLEGIPHRDKAEFMSQEELFAITDTFLDFGIKKIRLTGGEPLIKRNFDSILNHLSSKGVELAITTNGILLDKYWAELEAANLSSLNISIDSLQEERFNQITRRTQFKRIWKNIQEAVSKNLKVKLNVVLIKDENQDEIVDFIELTKEWDVSVRFIEFMPFDGNQWDWSRTVSYRTILDTVQSRYEDLEQIEMEANGTSRNFKVGGYKGSFGIISSVTNPFCDTCNRIRLTADGKIKNCLFSNKELDLLTAYRKGEDIKSLIQTSIQNKEKERAGLKPFEDKDFTVQNRNMTSIGG